MSDAGAVDADSPRRPVLVAVAVVLTMIVAVFGVIEGALVLLARYDAEVVADGAVLPVSLAGAAGILASILLGAIAAGVWRGSHAARIVVTALAVVGLALDVLTVLDGPADLWWTALDAVGYAFVIVALWAGRGTAAFFSARRGVARASTAL